MTGLVEEGVQSGAEGALGRVVHPVLRHHAIARRGARGPELLRVKLPSGEEVLPLFSYAATAQEFLVSRDLGEAWYARECYAGELVSMLLGLYAGIDGVLLDPVHGDATEGYVPGDFLRWKSFVGYLLGDGQEGPVGGLTRGPAYAAGAV